MYECYTPFRKYFNLITDDSEGLSVSSTSSSDDSTRTIQGSFYKTDSQQPSNGAPKPVLGRGSVQGVSSESTSQGQKSSYSSLQNGYSTAFYNQVVSSTLDNTTSLIGDTAKVQAEIFQELCPSRHSSGLDTVSDNGQESLPWNIPGNSEQQNLINGDLGYTKTLDNRQWQASSFTQQTSNESQFGSPSRLSAHLQIHQNGNACTFDQDISCAFDTMSLQDMKNQTRGEILPYSRRSSGSGTIDDPEFPQSVPWNTPTGSFSNLNIQRDQLVDNRASQVPVNHESPDSAGMLMTNGTIGSPCRSNTTFGSPSRRNGMYNLPSRNNGTIGSPARSNGVFDLPSRNNATLGLSSRSNSMFGSQVASNGMFGSTLDGSDCDALQPYSSAVYDNGDSSFNGASPMPGGWFDGTQNGNAVGQLSLANVQQLLLLLQGFQAHITNNGNRSDFGRNNMHLLEEGKFCAFCKKNRETPEFYRTHVVKDSRGKVICPVLRKYTCPVCQATGDKAHTLRHCPVRFQNLQLEQQISWSQGHEN